MCSKHPDTLTDSKNKTCEDLGNFPKRKTEKVSVGWEGGPCIVRLCKPSESGVVMLA